MPRQKRRAVIFRICKPQETCQETTAGTATGGTILKIEIKVNTWRRAKTAEGRFKNARPVEFTESWFELVRRGGRGFGNRGIEILDGHFLGSESQHMGILTGGVLDLRLGEDFVGFIFVCAVNRCA